MKACLALLVLGLASCATAPTVTSPSLTPGDPAAPSQTTPQETVAIAQRYANHQWMPFAKNILRGKDKDGVLVNTPDVGHEPGKERQGYWIPGQVNQGIPYKWGGFDDPASFDAAVAAGSAAGDVSSPAKRRADNAAVSSQAAGVDCSGFVSRCLQLPAVYDTAKLPSICDELPSHLDLQPGDLLNVPRRHVLLTAGWVDESRQWIYYYETGGAPDYWRPALRQAPIGALMDLGYKPLRYKGMARVAVADGKQVSEVLTRAAKASAAVVANPTIGEP